MKFSDVPENQLYWLAGLLEGEGSFLKPTPSAPNRPIVGLQSTDEDVIAKVAQIFGLKYGSWHSDLYKDKGWKRVFRVYLRGARAVEFMLLIKPLMGSRRQQQIDCALASYRPREMLIGEEKAKELARRYWEGERFPTALGRECGISKNLAIHYIDKYTPS